MNGPDSGYVRLDGDLGLRNGGELTARLTEVLNSHNDVVIDASQVTAVDISTIQILISAHKSAREAGKRFHVNAPLDGALGKVLVKAGFVTASAETLTPEVDLWRHEPTPSTGEAS
ncbi:MAG TPA: STAS domain-containing protein [Devosiaceae bacterium]|jgi:anti-anti-sigma regulatory factor